MELVLQMDIVSWGTNPERMVKIHNATSTSSYGSSYTVGDTIGVAMNLDTGELGL